MELLPEPNSPHRSIPFTEQDWEQTPLAVRAYLHSALGHMKVDTFGKRYLPTLHMAFNAKKTRAEIPTSSKESCCGNMAIRRL